MSSYTINNKRIARNTIFLYFRMVLIMGISFYTSRIILNALGESDFGIYNVVGGIVVILSFLNGAMTGATQRYLNVEMRRGNLRTLQETFATSINIHLWLSVAVFVLAESLGLWFLNSSMNIPASSMSAANVVYQCSVLSFIATVITVPHNAAIIAHEKMDVFAYISIAEAVFKLVSALLLLIVPSHLLIWYSVFMLITAMAPRFMLYRYSVLHFEECKRPIAENLNRKLACEMLSFSGWNIFGSLGYILHTQGIAIILNIFFGTIVNAAQGISMQVNTLVRSFSDSFLQAVKPQIIQSYAAGELEQMHQLVLRGCRLAIFLTAFFAIPILIECGSLLTLWLKIVPEYTIGFVRIVLLISLVDSFTPIMSTAQNATGKIKSYQVTLTAIGLFHLPLAVLFFWFGFSPIWSFYVYLMLSVVLQIMRVLFVCKSIKLSQKDVFIGLVFRPLTALLLASLLPALLHIYMSSSIYTTIIILVVSCISNTLTIGIIGLTAIERKSIFTLVGNKISSFRK